MLCNDNFVNADMDSTINIYISLFAYSCLQEGIKQLFNVILDDVDIGRNILPILRLDGIWFLRFVDVETGIVGTLAERLDRIIGILVVHHDETPFWE